MARIGQARSQGRLTSAQSDSYGRTEAVFRRNSGSVNWCHREALLAEMARHEAETLCERIQSGLAEARRKGIKLGRPIGTKLRREDFPQKHRDILRQLKARQSVRNAAKITGKGVSTVQRVKACIRY